MKPFYNDIKATKDELQNLKTYKSNGVDDSLIRKYILNPYLYETTVKFIPKTIAPNMITLIGFFFMNLTFFISYFYSGNDFKGNLPNLVFLINAIGIFLYQTLDNLDGKIARNLKQSSPLGEMFDHGVDALACTIGIMAFCCSSQIGYLQNDLLFRISHDSIFGNLLNYLLNSIHGITGGLFGGHYGGITGDFTLDLKWTFILLELITAQLPFIFATWEEYHIGFLYLGKFNGPIEGLLSIIFTQIIGFLFGHEIFHFTIFNLISLKFICVLSSTFLAIITSILNLKKILLKNLNDKNLNDKKNLQKALQKALQIVMEILPYFIYKLFLILIILINKENINKYPLILLFGICFHFGYLSSNITLCHLLKRKLPNIYNHLIYLITFILQFLAIFGGLFGLFIYCIGLFIIYCNFVLEVCDTISTYLGINVLTITPVKKDNNNDINADKNGGK
ncbi:hypothetical protein ABK040_013080 [Willaertia magna]